MDDTEGIWVTWSALCGKNILYDRIKPSSAPNAAILRSTGLYNSKGKLNEKTPLLLGKSIAGDKEVLPILQYHPFQNSYNRGVYYGAALHLVLFIPTAFLKRYQQVLIELR